MSVIKRQAEEKILDLLDLRKAWRAELADNLDEGDEFAAKGTRAILAMIENDLRRLRAVKWKAEYYEREHAVG